MKKRVLSVALVLCMVLALLPSAVIVQAATPTGTKLTQANIGSYTSLTGGSTESGRVTYYLSEDINTSSTIVVTGYVTLDMNGCMLKMTGANSAIKVDGGNLTLTNSTPKVRYFGFNSDGLAEYFGTSYEGLSGSGIEASGGVIVGGATAANGGGVHVTNNGTCTMKDGCCIVGCAATNGGGVAVTNGGTFVNEGTIAGCKATNGGGVYVGDKGTFTINRADVTVCTATTGNALYVSNSTNAVVHLNGGSILGSFGGSANINAGRGDCNTSLGSTGYNLVKFDLNGGQCDGSTAPINWLVVDDGKVAQAPSSPTKAGYSKFNGWYTAASGGTKVNPTTVTISDYYITFYAQYTPNNYTVTFDANGGTGTMANQSFTYDVAQVLTENAFTRTGYTFEGWATSADGSKVYDDRQSVQSLTTQSHVTLYACWTPSPATAPTVKVSNKNKNLTYGNSGSIRVTGTATDGHEITGYQWYSCNKAGSNGKIISGATKSKYTIKAGTNVGNYHYYCVVTATRKDNGQTATKKSITINVQVKVAAQAAPDIALFTATAPTVPGGSDGKITGTTTAMQYKLSTATDWIAVTGTEITGLVAGAYEIRYKSDKNHNSSDATTVTVNETYGITYDLGGGALPTGKTNPAVYTVDSGDILLNNPTKEGYDFIGWTGTDLTGDGHVAVTIPSGSTGNRSYTAQYAIKSGYTISFDMNGGRALADKTGVKWNDTILDVVSTPSRTGYTFQGWKHNGTDVTADTTYLDLATDDTDMSITLVAQWKLQGSGTADDPWILTKDVLDSEYAQTSVGSTLYRLKAGVYRLAEDITVTNNIRIEAEVTLDLNGHKLESTGATVFSVANNTVGTIARLTLVDHSAGKTGEVRNSTGQAVSIRPNTGFNGNDVPIYGTVINDGTISGGAFYGEVYSNDSGATITGGTFYGAVTFDGTISGGIFYGNVERATVKDSAKVTVTFTGDGWTETQKVLKGQKASAPTRDGYSCDGCYTDSTCGTAFDFANTPILAATTIYTEWTHVDHSGGTATCKNKAVCETCGQPYGEKDGANHTGEKEWSTKNETQHEQTWKCCGTVEVALEDHEWQDGVCEECGYVCLHTGGTADCTHKAVCTVCGEEYGDVSPDNHTDEKEWSTKNETQHEQTWKCCGAVEVALEDHEWKDGVCEECGYVCLHTGGTADCTHKAVCTVCGEEYGEVDSGNHDLENIQGNAATVTEKGNTEYWHCKDCDGNFSDKDGKNTIDLKETVIGKLPPEIIEGKGQSLTAGERRELIFRSNAAFGDFIRVELDGETVDGKNYTVKEGSTIVTLKADYVATLSVGEHTLGIVSESGTATTTFTVHAKAVNDNTTPATGDHSQMVLWLALALLSGGALVGTGVYGKRKKRFVK